MGSAVITMKMNVPCKAHTSVCFQEWMLQWGPQSELACTQELKSSLFMRSEIQYMQHCKHDITWTATGNDLYVKCLWDKVMDYLNEWGNLSISNAFNVEMYNYLIAVFVTVTVLQGYQGLVDGGDNIRPATWESVSMMLQLVSHYIYIRNFLFYYVKIKPSTYMDTF